MSHHLESTTLLAQRLAIRRLRGLALLACLVLAAIQIELAFLNALYGLGALLLLTMIIDLRRSKAVLSRTAATMADWWVSLLTLLFLVGIVLLTGRTASPLLGILLLPPILFGLEFGFPASLLGSAPLATMVIWGLLWPERNIDATRLNGLVLLILLTVLLAAIFDFRRIHLHYRRKTSRMLLLDDLTQLYNRRFLKQELLCRLRARIPFALVILDLNYFKFYNDRWGHPGGDTLLISLAAVLREATTPCDMVIRLSGDEFILLLEEAEPATVDRVLNRLKTLLAERHFPGEECFPAGKLSISHGYVLCRDETRSFEEILAAADAALYENKKEHTG